MRSHLLNLCLLAGALGASVTPAFAKRDAVQFGSNIQIARNTSVHDAVCFFCNVDARGTIEGNVVVFFGNINIAEKANHDAVDFFGNITAGNDVMIGHNMVSMFGSIRLGENVSVGKDLVAIFGGLHASPSVRVGGNRVVEPGWFFWGPLLIFLLVIVLVVREFRAHRRHAYGYPFPPRQ